jgi:prepilin-type N-terminal cleavage/methylation domain-containing protein
LAYDLQNLKYGKLPGTLLLEKVSVNNKQFLRLMLDSENTKVGDMRVLAQKNFQIMADSRGFTLVELIMVVVLIAVLSVTVLPKFLDTSSITVEGAAEMVAADIRYTQELAMSSNDDKKVDFPNGSSTYTLKNSDDSVFRTVKLPSGVTVSSANIMFTFNSLGEPIAGGGSFVTLSAGADTKTITVDSYTGRVSSS